MKTAFLAGALLVSATILTAQPVPSHWKFAPTPPIGWNSWDCFGTTLTETQAKAQADAMARELLPSGYKYFTVDIQWYEPNAQGHGYKETAFHPNPEPLLNFERRKLESIKRHYETDSTE